MLDLVSFVRGKTNLWTLDLKILNVQNNLMSSAPSGPCMGVKTWQERV